MIVDALGILLDQRIEADLGERLTLWCMTALLSTWHLCGLILLDRMFEKFLSLERKIGGSRSNVTEAKPKNVGDWSFRVMISADTVFWVVGIITYGIYQYRKREKNHRLLLQNLIEGKEAKSVEAGTLGTSTVWRLWTISLVEALLLGAIVWLVSVRSRILYGRGTVYILAGIFLALFLSLLLILLRDIKAHQGQKRKKG